MQGIDRAAAWAAAVLVAVAIGLGGSSSARARDFDFSHGAIRFSDGLKGYTGFAIHVGDANHDGRDDLVVILEEPRPAGATTPTLRRAYVHLQRDDGTLASAIVLATPMQNMNAIKVVDLEGDGHAELVVGYDGGLLVYRWNGTEFVPSATPASFDCRYMAVGDIDGNGTRDVVCNAQSSGVVAVYRVAVDGDVSDPGYMQVATSAMRSFKLGDATGDGLADLLQADMGLWSFQVYPNDGSGGFLPARSYTFPLDYYSVGFNSTAIEAFDVDADGVNEVVVPRHCNRPCARMFVYRLDSAGVLRYWRQFSTYEIPASLEKHDVDGDGHLDLVVGHSGWGAVGRYMGVPNGLSLTEHLSGAMIANIHSFDLAFGDLNSDGRTDLATVINGWQAELKYGIGKRPADLDGNFQSDLVWRDTIGGRNLVWDDGFPGRQRPLASVAAPWTIKAIADFNGDDAADLFWRNPSNGANMIWLGGDATKTQDVAPLAPEWQLAGSGDLDGDLVDDVLWRNATNGANRIWFGGRETQAIDINTEAVLAWQVAGVGDFDGDHNDDVLWRHATTGANRVWFSANAATAADLAPVPNMAWKVVGVGDFNLDGMDDVIWRNTSTGAHSLWRSANAARQQPVAAVANQAWQIVAVGDYWGDGMADLVWRHAGTGSMLLWHDADVARQYSIGVGGTAWKVMP